MAVTLMVFSSAQAQATRTWVSGVGDDVNPCSRTAPCKTFAGAISKTAVDGEINAIDSGGFGAVTITKAITIDGQGVQAGILAAGTTGVIVNLTAASGSNKVQLRNLSINGATSGFFGIRILSSNVTGVKVFVENTVIMNFRGNGTASRGISDERTVVGSLNVQNTLVKNNSGSGIVTIGAGGTTATIENSQAKGNGAAGFVVSGAFRIMTVRDSVASNNVAQGFVAEVSSRMDIINSLTANNTTGIESNTSAEIRVSRSTISRNTSNGLVMGGGTILSYGNNELSANAGNNGPFSPAGPTLQ
jgi:hypothetical protein